MSFSIGIGVLLSLLGLLYTASCNDSSSRPQSPRNTIKSHNESQTKVTFGSCNKYYRSHKSDIFYDVAAMKADVWVWLGDIAYIDTMSILGIL